MTAPLINNLYRSLHSLGEGGFGKTFLAEDTHKPSRARCVIKQLKPVVSRSEVFAIIQQRFGREAAVLESLGSSHSQIPDLYAYFEEHSHFYLVQEWMEGSPLSEVSRIPWSEQQIHRLLVDTLEVLVHVHNQNIIHRDIKPDNIILRRKDQRPCLIDFGAVKEVMSTVLDENNHHQKSSLAIGTPGFMAPEQAIGRPTFASDLYSLGMSALYLLTGHSPLEFQTDQTTGEVLWHQYAPHIPAHLRDVIDRAIQPYGQARFMNAADMLEVLQRNQASALTFPKEPNNDASQQDTPLPPTQKVSRPNSESLEPSSSSSITAKELHRRYLDGARNFRRINLKGQSLRGMNLEGIDLSGANLSNTDLRGTRFINARLVGTQFYEARMGVRNSNSRIFKGFWFVLWILVSWCFSLFTASLNVLPLLDAKTVSEVFWPLCSFLILAGPLYLKFKLKNSAIYWYVVLITVGVAIISIFFGFSLIFLVTI